MNFAVFSDDPCRISYVESIPIPLGHTQVELYGIEPGARTQWIVVKQLDGNKATLKVFLRQNVRRLQQMGFVVHVDEIPVAAAQVSRTPPRPPRRRTSAPKPRTRL